MEGYLISVPEGEKPGEGFQKRENHSLPDGTYVTYFPESETVLAVNYDTGDEWHFRETNGAHVEDLTECCLCKEDFVAYYEADRVLELYTDVHESIYGHMVLFDVGLQYERLGEKRC